MKDDYKIRKITHEELDTAIEWAANEGWNPGFYDADSFYATDPNGFYMGFLNGKPISSISAVSYDSTFGFMGFYIVHPEYRGKGYGIKIWNESLKHLPTQNIGLDGVVEQQENYKKSGFQLAHRNIRYEGKGVNNVVVSSKTVPLSKIPFKQLLEYDNKLFPTSRPKFLKPWIKQPESLAVGFVENKNLLGYGMVRKCRMGFKIGPLFANEVSIADTLFQELRLFAGERIPVFLDVPEVNKDAVRLAEGCKMKPMFETARMYTKKAPDIELGKVFGITTFELG